MAEGWAKHFYGDSMDIYSAGVETHGLNPYAVKVMQEAGMDISGHNSKLLGSLSDVVFDYVVTVCDNAYESCPVFPGKTEVIHRSFDDPPRMAEKAKSEEEVLNCYRTVRDEIKCFVETMRQNLGE